jgi:CRP-like cAMP-binding protein
MLPFQRMLRTCGTACGFHSKLIENMVAMLARKNLVLNEKLEILSGRSIRERVMLYLQREARRQGSRRVRIPFTRTELADYVCVDRSALSREISRMCAQRLIETPDTHTIVII